MILFHRHYGEGPALVILHGLFGQSDNWATIARKLGENGYSVYCMDLRNHGMSEHSDEFSIALMARDVIETLDDLRLRSAHVLGHSMGGKVAMELALHYPDRLRSLLVIDIGPQYYPPHHHQIIKGLEAVKPEELRSRKEADERLSNYVGQAEVRQFLLKNLTRESESEPFRFRFNLEQIAANINEVGKALPEGIVQVPTLFYHGEKSDYLKPETYAEISAQFIASEFKIMPGAGHWLHAEQPPAFIATVTQWLSRFR